MQQDNSSFFWWEMNCQSAEQKWSWMTAFRTAAIHFGSDLSNMKRCKKVEKWKSAKHVQSECSIETYGLCIHHWVFFTSHYSTVSGSSTSSSSSSLLSCNSRSFSHYHPFLYLPSPAERKREITGGLSYLWLQLSVLPSDCATQLVSLLGCQASHTHTHTRTLTLTHTCFGLVPTSF